MGFYSIYKIIKDMFRTIFGNRNLKLLFISIFIIIIIFFFDKNVVNASNTFTVTTTNNYTLIIPNEYITYDYIYILSMNGQFFCIGTNSYLYRQSSFSYRTVDDSTMLKSNGISINNTTLDFSNVTPYIDSTRPAQFYGGSSSIYCEFCSAYLLDSDISTVIKQPNFVKPSSFVSPTLSNTQSQLENLAFSNFTINANDYTEDIENNDGVLYMLFYNRSLSNSQTTDGLYPIKEKAFTKGSIYTDYDNSTSENIVFSYPIFMSGVFFNIGSTYEIRFAKKTYNAEYNTDFYQYFGNTYIFTISSDVTQDYINQLNQQTATSSDQENEIQLNNAINEQTNAINNQTQSIDNINNSINDSSVDSSSLDLPTDNTVDPTQSGVDNIFQTIYNSFTNGTAQDIVFPIPFSNNNLVIQPNYVSNMLGSSQRRKSSYLTYSSILLVFNQSIYNY